MTGIARPPLIEVCVEDPAGIEAAVSGMADRIELCSALALGGLTPPAGLMAHAASAGIAVRALIRPRAGNFHYSPAERDLLRRDIDAAGEAGLSGIVIGASTAEGTLDRTLIAELVQRAKGSDGQGMDVALHRVVDVIHDPLSSVELAIDLGIATILTSGGARSAIEGTAVIAEMTRRAGDRVEILPGGGITPANAASLLRATGVRALHASCSRPAEDVDPALLAFGFALPGQRHTDTALVRALRDAATQAA